ncbi:MAG: DNA gyrase inhibitor YacG [Actinomycetota bacterium]|nr:DNA gyrase inhibitor YacG [Actinomycetota bacterium]
MKTKCPVCKKEAQWEGNPFRPFCSERCRQIDLGLWVSEEYRIPGESAEKEDVKKTGEDGGEEDE